MNKDEALQLALQLVSNLRTHSWTVADEQLVITAIKEALAQPEQEPVIVGRWPSAAIGKETLQDALKRENGTPPQRTWVGLTDAEVKKIVGSDRYTDLLLEVVNFVEAKLKEKNCG